MELGRRGEEFQHRGDRAPKVTASCVPENLQSVFTKLTQCAMGVDFLWKSVKGWMLRLTRLFCSHLTYKGVTKANF